MRCCAVHAPSFRRGACSQTARDMEKRIRSFRNQVQVQCSRTSILTRMRLFLCCLLVCLPRMSEFSHARGRGDRHDGANHTGSQQQSRPEAEHRFLARHFVREAKMKPARVFDGTFFGFKSEPSFISDCLRVRCLPWAACHTFAVVRGLARDRVPGNLGEERVKRREGLHDDGQPDQEPHEEPAHGGAPRRDEADGLHTSRSGARRRMLLMAACACCLVFLACGDETSARARWWLGGGGGGVGWRASFARLKTLTAG